MNRDRTRIFALLRKGARFLITGHVNPDGDSVGSACALRLALRALGKRADIVMAQGVPRVYRFLPEAKVVRAQTPGSWRAIDALVVLDCGEAHRANGLLTPRPPVPVVNIDHHATNPGYGDLNWVDSGACSTAEIVAEIVAGLGVRPDPEIAEALYTGILTDTGCFQHGNATPRSFRIAGRLVAAGADPARIAQAVYESVLFDTLPVLGETLAALRRTADGQVAWITLPHSVLGRLASPAEAEEWVNFPRSVDSVRIALCFKETPSGEVRLSFRSKGDVDVARLAARWGGGGHRNAAGATAPGPLAGTVREVVAAARRYLVRPRSKAIPRPARRKRAGG